MPELNSIPDHLQEREPTPAWFRHFSYGLMALLAAGGTVELIGTRPRGFILIAIAITLFIMLRIDDRIDAGVGGERPPAKLLLSLNKTLRTACILGMLFYLYLFASGLTAG